MIDTHCHLNYDPLATDVAGVVSRAQEVGVEAIIIPGTSLETSESAVALANEFPSVYACVGIHPSDAHEAHPADLERLEALVTNPKVVAVGEIGLDYYHFDGLGESEIEARKALQEAYLLQQLALARTYRKPVIIHSRDCFDDLYMIMKREATDLPVVIHCFTGTEHEAKAWLELGFHLSFTGILTYKSAANLREIARSVPFDRVMIETDGPFLAPEGFRGQPCEPAMVVQVARCIAECRGIDVSEVDTKTTATAKEFFSL